uniref:RING-type domain-containing protein n=1 Tax=Amphimedon queenslandica TaxID=400682 RepID=A0A1X7TIU5_AMPQE
MAAQPSSSGLLKLEEQLTCPIFLEHYTNPKTLPCLHSFCQPCLEELPLDKTSYLTCPLVVIVLSYQKKEQESSSSIHFKQRSGCMKSINFHTPMRMSVW